MTETILDCNQIQEILPQSYPFALIDRVVEFKKGESLVAVKNITANEWPVSFVGAPDTRHQAPGKDVFPRTLLIEAAAQAALLLYHLSMVTEGEHPRYVLGRIKAEFFDDARVGDEVLLKVGKGRMLANGGYSDVQALLGDQVITDMTIIFSVSR